MPKLHLNMWNGDSRKTIPILALHGFTGSGLDFECFIEETGDLFSWWAPDLMGHGKSLITDEVSDYSFSSHVGYLDEIAQEIGSSFVLLGYSMGGRLALRYAIERPEFVKQLILVGATPGILDSKERELRRVSDEVLADSIIKEGVESFLKKWQEQPLISSQRNIPNAIREKMFSRRLENRDLGLANSLRGMGAGVMEPMWDRLWEIKCPVTLITGETDEKFSKIAQKILMGTSAIVHKRMSFAGHAAIWENMGDFVSLLRADFKKSL